MAFVQRREDTRSRSDEQTRGKLVGRSPELARRREVARAWRPTVDELSLAVDAEPVQLKRLDSAVTDVHREVAWGNRALYGDPIPPHLAVQRRGEGGTHDDEAVHAAAARGVSGAGGALPYLETIQAAFGRHDVGGVRAHVGGTAAAAAEAIGAEAYATGDRVAFRGAPSLHTAAHEAAHVVQQRAGVSLKGGVGAAGDVYERHADAVADLVVQGKSAEGLLDRVAPARGVRAASALVQRKTWTGNTAKGAVTIGPWFEASWQKQGEKTTFAGKGKTSFTKVFPIEPGLSVQAKLELGGAVSATLGPGDATAALNPYLKGELGLVGGIPGAAGLFAGGDLVAEARLEAALHKGRPKLTGAYVVISGEPFIKAFADVEKIAKEVKKLKAQSGGERFLAENVAAWKKNVAAEYKWSPGRITLAKWSFDTGKWEFPALASIKKWSARTQAELIAKSLPGGGGSKGGGQVRDMSYLRDPAARQRWQMENLKRGLAEDWDALKHLFGF